MLKSMNFNLFRLHTFFAGNASLDKEKLRETFLNIFNASLQVVPSFWNYTLFTVDKSPITAGNVLVAFAFVICGYLSIRMIVNYFETRVLTKLEIEISKRYTIKILMFYFLLSVLLLITLYLIKVPLTVFTVIGGALALGIGFGAKNIMNNFISGIAIVIEHPIRVGDVIEVGDLIGVVENIGFRAATIRSLTNVTILIPNSFLLENNVLNWTLSDKVVRCDIQVGVQYGSDVEKVKELLLKVTANHEKILTYNNHQKPIVFLSEFGESSLVFDLYFWIAIERMLDIKKISSEIRFSIIKEFKKANLVIAFPQKDIHVKEPVQVQITRSS